jgi:DNA-binding transcriptional ArsR family regulator
MAKDPFLLVSLEESESKNLAQVISNDTARKILDYLSKAESATESEISKELDVPLSTVHYNLQSLVKANLVKTEEFHYSEKGKEVLHYTLANKIIIIAPKSANKDNFLQKLKGILPVAFVSLGAAAIIQVASKYFKPAEYIPAPEASLMMVRSADIIIEESADAAGTAMAKVAEAVANETMDAAASTFMQASADNITKEVTQEANVELMAYASDAALEAVKQPINIFSGDYIALWFLTGSMVAIVAMLAWNAYKSKKSE